MTVVTVNEIDHPKDGNMPSGLICRRTHKRKGANRNRCHCSRRGPSVGAETRRSRGREGRRSRRVTAANDRCVGGVSKGEQRIRFARIPRADALIYRLLRFSGRRRNAPPAFRASPLRLRHGAHTRRWLSDQSHCNLRKQAICCRCDHHHILYRESRHRRRRPYKSQQNITLHIQIVERQSNLAYVGSRNC